MKVFITRKQNGKKRYLIQWIAEGNGHYNWFNTLKEIYEYTKDWNAEYIKTNF